MIFGRTKYYVEDVGVNILNRLRRFGLRKIICSDTMISFESAFKNRTEITRILGKKCQKTHDFRGIFGVLDVVLGRFCVTFTAVLCICLWFFAEQFAFRINVRGVSGDELNAVNAYLATQNIDGITAKKELSVGLCNELVKTFPFVAGANIRISGATAIITVLRAENFVPDNSEILAPVDGVIFDITVFSGEAKVAPGKVIHIGDVLVSGARPMAIIKISNGSEIIYEFNNTLFNAVTSL